MIVSASLTLLVCWKCAAADIWGGSDVCIAAATLAPAPAATPASAPAATPASAPAATPAPAPAATPAAAVGSPV